MGKFSRLLMALVVAAATVIWLAPRAVAEDQVCAVFPDSPEAGVNVTVGTWYSFKPEDPAATLTQQADLFTEPNWDGEDLGYGIEDEPVRAYYWAVDSDCALWYQVLVNETTGWTPAYNVIIPGVRHY